MIPEQLERFSPKLLKGLLEERDPKWGLLTSDFNEHLVGTAWTELIDLGFIDKIENPIYHPVHDRDGGLVNGEERYLYDRSEQGEDLLEWLESDPRW